MKKVATTLDEAYLMYMKMHDHKPPTASRFKKFINDQKRVQIGQIDFVTCDKYLRTTGRGRKSSTVSPRANSSSTAKRKKLNLTRPKSISWQVQQKQSKSTAILKHKRSSKSVDYKDGDKRKHSNNKSRAEKPITSIASLSNTKLYKNKYGTRKTSIGRKQKSQKTMKTYHNKSMNSKKTRNKSHSKKNRKNGIAKIPLTGTNNHNNNNRNNVDRIRNNIEHVEIPNDEELCQLISEISSSPLNGMNGGMNSNSNGNINNFSNSNDLNEVNSVLKSFPFFEHMLLSTCQRLRVNDKIDHRYTNGRYICGTILGKIGSKIKLSYDKYGAYQNKHDVWSDYKYEIYRFAKYHSITLRPAHRMVDVNVGHYIDFNPIRHKKKSHRGWKTAEVIKRDYKSGQIKVEYAYKTRKCDYWTHLDNINEVSPFGTMVNANTNVNVNINVNVANNNNNENAMDLEISSNGNGNGNISNKALEFANKFAELNLDTSILMEQKSGYIDEDTYTPTNENESDNFSIQLDFQNIDTWGNNEVIYWFNIIENGCFGHDIKYLPLRNALRNYVMNGKDLLQFNDVFLRMVGVNDKNDRNVILTNIKKIAPNQAKIKNGHNFNRNVSQVEIDKGIKKATQKYNKENRKLKNQILKLEESNEEIKNEHQTKLSELERLRQEFIVVQKQRNKPSKDVIQLRQENERINEKLSKLTSTLTGEKKTLNSKNDELILLRKKITSLNKEIQCKDEKITAIKLETSQQIIQLKMELQVMTDKCNRNTNTNNISHVKNDSTKNSEIENKKEILFSAAVHEIENDNKYNYDATSMSDGITTPDSPQSESVSTVSSISGSVVSVNSASPDQYNSDTPRTIIIDNGSETIKIGYASSEISESHKPWKKFHSIIGRAKNISVMNQNKAYIGDEAYNKSSILNIKNVIHRGNVTDWDSMQQLWDYTFYDKFNIAKNNTYALSNMNVLLTESLLREKREREKSVQVMFETYDINSMYLMNEAVLSLYGCGKITGSVLGIGYGITYSAAIFEGMCLPQSIIRVNSSGYDISQYLKQILCEKYSQILKHTKHSIFKDIKQKYCFVADNFHESLKINANSYKKYKLPDGQSIRIGNERFRAAEQLFAGFINLNNEAMFKDTRKLFNQTAAFDKSGIHHMINTSINLVNDKQIKKELYSNIILSGGSTLFKGLPQRLHHELCKLNQQNQQIDINIIANEKRKYLAWIGGSIVSSLSNYLQNFIQKDEYEEEGPRIVHTKCP